MIVRRWEGCYNSSWKGLITPASFSHPAKFSRGLIERIYDHCLERGFLKRGDIVGDPFAGIGSGGVTAAWRNLVWIGVELEPRFVEMAKANFSLHDRKWNVGRFGFAMVVQGDSRQFHKIVESAAMIVSSPPFAGTSGQGGGGINVKGYVPARGRKWTGTKSDPVGSRTYQGRGAERSTGNIETLKEGTVHACISSPPFRDARSDTTKSNPTKHGGPCADRHHTTQAGAGYGEEPGQIDNLPSGTIDACISSPPYEETLNHGGGPDTRQDLIKGGKSLLGIKDGYGASDGQIGKKKGETYWQAVDQVYRSCFQSLKPGGHLILVVKDYVKKGKRVLLCEDTCHLLEHVGFTIVERIHAMLVSETKHNDLFEGVTTTTKSRKSFFRRLAENKGSPAIDYEEVLISRRP